MFVILHSLLVFMFN